DRVGELTLAPVVDGGDLALAVAGQLLVETLEPLVDGGLFERRVEDVDDFVVPHGSRLRPGTAPRGARGRSKAREYRATPPRRPPLVADERAERLALHVEAEEHDIAVLDDVILPLAPDEALFP